MNVSDIREGGLPSKCSCRELDGAMAKTPSLEEPKDGVSVNF